MESRTIFGVRTTQVGTSLPTGGQSIAHRRADVAGGPDAENEPAARVGRPFPKNRTRYRRYEDGGYDGLAINPSRDVET